MMEYKFTLPLETNDGKSYAEALGKFSREAMRLAGGVTIGEAQQGAWMDDEGKLYLEPVRPYFVACDAEKFAALKASLPVFFPDQKAFYVVASGTAEVINV